MSLPRFLRGFNKTKSSSSSTHLGHNQVASDLNLSDASSSSSSSSSSGPKDALGQPLPVSTVIISSKKPASISLTTSGLDIISESQSISPSASSVSASASTSTDGPGSQDTPLASLDLSIPSSKHNSRSSSRSRSSTGSIAVPIPINSSSKHRSRRSSHNDDDKDTNGPPESSLLSTSCPNFTFTTFSDSVPTPPISRVHITSPRPPRPSYPLPPIPVDEPGLSSLSSSLPTSTSAIPRRVRSNALSVLSDSELSLNSGTPGNSLGAETETFSRPGQDQAPKIDKDDHHIDDKGVTTADETTRTPATPRSRSLSASTSADSTSTSSRPVSILKKPRSILRSRSGSQPLLPEPMARTGSGSESLIPAFPAPPSTSRHSGSSVTSLASTCASWYLQHDPTAMARRDEGRGGPEVVPVPRVRRSSSRSHSPRRLSGRDQDLKDQDTSHSNSNIPTTTTSTHRPRMSPTTSNPASPSGPDDHDPVTKRRGSTNPDTTASVNNRLSFPSLNDFKPPSSLAPSLPGLQGPDADQTTTDDTPSSSSPSSIAQATPPQNFTPLSLKTLRQQKSKNKLRQEPQIGVATGMCRNSLPKSSLTTGTETPSDLPPLPSVSPPPTENNTPSYAPRRNTEGALSSTTLDVSQQQHQQGRRRENSYNSTVGGYPMAPVMPRPILKDTSAKDKALRESWMSEPPGNGINISHHSRPASGMTPGSSSSSPSPITPPKSLARANSASAKRQSKLSRMSAVEYDQDALTPRPRQPTVNGYGPDYRPRRQSGGPGHLLCALDPASGGIDESEDIDDSDLDDSLSRSKHLQDQYIRLQKSQLRQSIAENPVLPHGSSPDNTPYDKPRQRKSLGDELNVPPVPEKSAQRKRVSTMGSATLPAVSPSLSGALASVSESDSKKQKDRKPFATVGSNALSFEPLFVLKDGSPKQSRESSMLTTYRDSLASRLSGVSDADWASNPLLTDIIQPGVSILDLSKKDLIDIPSGLPTSITHLRLAYNSIHILAPLSSLTSLHQLQVLDLCDNQLDVLPSEIGLLSKLKELYLSNNKLWKLPDTIQRMARLEVLDIRGNQFYLLNPAIGRMKTLRQLDVRNNQLKSLPAPLCMLSTTLSVLLVDGNQFVQPFSDLLQPLFADSESGPQSFLGDDPYADSGRKNGSSTIKSTGVYEPWRRSVAPSTVKRVPTLIKRRSHGDLMTIVGLQKKEGYSNSTDDLAAELQKASTISGSAGAYIAASLGADSSPGRRERSVSTSNAGPSEFHSESGSSHSLSLNKFMKSFRKSSKSSLKDPSVSSSKKRLSAGSELEPSEDGHGSESVYGGSQYEQDDSGAKGAHHSGKRGTSGGINQWVRDRFHKRANSNELGSLPNASSTSINLDAQDSEPHSVRDSGYDGVGTPHSPDLSAPSSGLGARMNKSTGHLPFGSPVSPRETQLLSSFDPLLKKDRDYRFSYMSMESQMTQGTENDVDALDISVPLSSAQHRLSSMYSPTTPLPSSPVMLATSAGSNSAWNSGAGPRYGQSAAQIKPIMHYLKDLHDLDPDSSEWEEVYAWRRVWNAERSTTLGLTGNEADQDQDQEEGGQQAKAEEMRLAKLQAQATRRRKIIAEIIETERTYVDGLKGLVEIYLTPAQQVMPASDHKGVFSNAQALYTFHASHFLPELEKAYAVTRETKTPIASSSPMSPIPSSSPFLSDPSAPTSASSSTAALGVHQESVGQSSDISAMSTPQESCIEGTNGDNTGSVIATTPPPETECRIGRVFAEHVAYMKMYSFYVNNYDNALRVLQTQLTHSKYKKKTKEFLRRCAKHPNHTQLGLQGYLLLPVQRIPRYKMLLGDLLENTWPDHVDYQDIATALDNVSSRADEMNERKRQYENHEKVLLVQNRIVGQYKTPLVQPHRKVVREGMLHLIRTVTRNVSMSEKAVVPTGQTPVGDLTMHHLSEETVEKSFLFILFNDIMIQCQPCGPKTSSSTTNVTGAGAGGTGGSGVTAGAGSGANAAGASDGTKNLELCRVLQLESRLHPAEVIGNDVLRVVDDAMVMYLTGDKDVIQAWKEDINSRW